VNRAVSARPRWLVTLLTAGFTAALVALAARAMFAVFMFYDDEGYVLISYRNFAEGGALYREIFSQYGPFPFVVHWILHLAGVPLNHAGGRVVTLCLWVLVALALAALAGRATRSAPAGILTLAGTFSCLFVMTSEPSHPGGLIVALGAAAAAGGWVLLHRGHTAAWAALIGAVTAALLLTKINVGVFAAFAAVAWYSLHLRAGPLRRISIAAVLVGCVLLPLLLMRDKLGEPWVLTLALTWSAAAVAVVATATGQGPGDLTARPAIPALLSGALAGAVILAIPFARGTGLPDLFDGILFGPLRNAVKFSHPVSWPPGMIWYTAASIASWATALALRRRYPAETGLVVAVLRIALTVGVVVCLVRPPPLLVSFSLYTLTLPALWPLAWRLGEAGSNADRARTWVLLLLLGQCLHAYPVAGSQVAWGCVLMIPLAAIGSWEAVQWLRANRSPRFAPRAGGLAAGTLALGAVAGALGASWNLGQESLRRSDGVSLGLPGTGPLRQPVDSAALLRVLTLNATAHADVLFSEPGMFSFNLWSGAPSPTAANVTHWFSLLGEGRQREILLRLAASPRAVVIADQLHMKFLRDRGFAPAGPLHDFIAREFEPAFQVADLEFRVRRGRSIRPFLLAELLSRAEAAGDGERHLIRLPLLLPTKEPVVAIDLAPGHPASVRLNSQNTRLEITPLSPRGDPTGPAAPASWPIAIDGPALLLLYFSAPDPSRLPRETSLLLRNGDGGEEALARFAP
jgi:hypothetical protein